MAQALQIKPAIFPDAPTVAAAPKTVAAVQPETAPQALPAWYLTPVVFIPMAAAAFIIGNVLLMIPWQVL